MLKAILSDLGETKIARSQADLVAQMNRVLLERIHRGRDIVLIIDEAQNLKFEVLEQIRLLSNLETDKQKLLQIVLMGQPELKTILARDELRQQATEMSRDGSFVDFDSLSLGVRTSTGLCRTPSGVRVLHSNACTDSWSNQRASKDSGSGG
mgnify:CR=1 FL=1